MPASEMRSSARVAPRSVMRLAATSATTASGPVAVDSTQPVQVASATELAAKAAEDEAREVEWARMREKTIEVQKKLRAEQAQEKQDALGKDERCMDGVKFKRVSNGWVQTGNC